MLPWDIGVTLLAPVLEIRVHGGGVQPSAAAAAAQLYNLACRVAGASSLLSTSIAPGPKAGAPSAKRQPR